MKISIIIPTIRVHKWEAIYNSIVKSTSKSFELIFVGPEYNKWADKHRNIKFIRDFGSPNRCQQIGACHATGDILTWSADDGLFFEDKIDKVVDFHVKQPHKSITSMKYGEGDNVMNDNSYYLLSRAYPFIRYLNHHKFILNGGVFWKQDFDLLGGWDCEFDVTCVAHADLAIRAYNAGYDIVLFPEPILQCEHMPDTTGDHAPIHHSQIDYDVPLFQKIYNMPGNIKDRKFISLDNWKKSPAIWSRRFT